VKDWEVDSSLEAQISEKGWSMLRCSAKTGEGVEEAFALLARKMLG